LQVLRLVRYTKQNLGAQVKPFALRYNTNGFENKSRVTFVAFNWAAILLGGSFLTLSMDGSLRSSS
jgi:hypothetical protein